MKELRIILIQAVLSLALLKAGDLPALSEARGVYPEYFSPGVVSPANINGENGYVVCVFGKRDFASESDEDILSYLQIRAKKDILSYLKNSTSENFKCNIERFIPIYKWKDGDLVYASYYIPESGIQKEQLAKKDDTTIPVQKNTLQPVEVSQQVEVTSKNTSEAELFLKNLEEDFIGKNIIEDVNLLEINSKFKKNTNKLLDNYLNLKKTPNSECDLTAIAIKAEQTKNTKVALTAYLRLKEINPINPEEIDFKIASLYESDGDLAKALDKYKKFNENYRTSKKTPLVLKKISELQFKIR